MTQKTHDSAWVDYGHMLGNNIQEKDRISFQSDQNNDK